MQPSPTTRSSARISSSAARSTASRPTGGTACPSSSVGVSHVETKAIPWGYPGGSRRRDWLGTGPPLATTALISMTSVSMFLERPSDLSCYWDVTPPTWPNLSA